MAPDRQKILFIYNADSGLMNAVKDSWKKFSDPENYDCNLCALTYGYFSENNQWKQFRHHTKAEMVFLHRDEFNRDYASKFNKKFEWPAVLEEHPQEGLQILLTRDDLNAMTSVDELIAAVNKHV